MNILNGGRHADNSVDLQEFMVVPLGAPSFSEGLRYSAETFHELKRLLLDNHLSTCVGDEGGFSPNLKSDEEALDLIMRAIERAGYRPDEDIAIAIDSAATSLYFISTPLIPGYVEADQVKKIAAFIACFDRSIPYTLLAFGPHFQMSDLPPTSPRLAQEAEEAAHEAGLTHTHVGNQHLLEVE